MKKIALYDPFLNTLGGGEKYILSILKVFDDSENEITIFWNKNLTKEINDRFPLNLSNEIYWRKTDNISSSLKTLQTLRTFDCFFYMTDGSYFFSSAKKNFIYAMVPNRELYPSSIINRLKTKNFSFITHSHFVQNQLKKWNIDSETIYPYIPLAKNIDLKNKKKVILMVGRFFRQLHSKKHDKAILVFNKLKKLPQFRDFSLIIAGGLKKEDQSYFNKLKSLSNNDPSIIFKPNVSLNELEKLYKLATYFWHFTGYGIDENIHPEQIEHLGITPLEAISFGNATFCYNAGGPKEIIDNGKTGFLFNNDEELIKKMIKIEENEGLKKEIIDQGRKMIKDNFSYKIFREKVLKTVFI